MAQFGNLVSHSPIVLARKPLDGTVAANVLEHGTGAINVDGCRIDASDKTPAPVGVYGRPTIGTTGHTGQRNGSADNLGRWPANIMHDGSPEVLAGFPDSKPATSRTDTVSQGMFHGGDAGTVYGDTGSAARFFYSPKNNDPEPDFYEFQSLFEEQMFSDKMNGKLYVGDNLEHIRKLPDNSVDAVVTDPPYGLGKEPDPRAVLRDWLVKKEFRAGGSGFMGREWDAFVPSPVLWMECYRVLKPGGHLLSFAGTRTYDWVVMGLRLAGFQIRDQIMWIYGSGFPKSLNISAAIDRQRDDRDDVYRVTAWIRAARDAAGVTNRQIDDAFGFASMAGHWTSSNSQSAVPTIDQIPPLLAVLGVTLDDVPEEIRRLIWTLNGRKGQPGAAWFQREVIGTAKSSLGGTVAAGDRDADYIERHRSHSFNITAPATEAAQRWDGWGTALKPAHEPVVLCRKPLVGTVADNVLEHGTGAINIDGCRVPTDDDLTINSQSSDASNRDDKIFGKYSGGLKTHKGQGQELGRWPANIMHDGSPEVLAGFPVTGPARAAHRGEGKGATQTLGVYGGASTVRGHDDAGGTAARFFYHAKASRAEREAGLESLSKSVVDPSREQGSAGRDNPRAGAGRSGEARANIHPTVKPLNLMRYMVKLVTPPGGTVLDPYAGSGTTLIAAQVEGFRWIGMELETNHAVIAYSRVSHWSDNPPEDAKPLQPPYQRSETKAPVKKRLKKVAARKSKSKVVISPKPVEGGD